MPYGISLTSTGTRMPYGISLILRELACHMGSHSVTCHPAEVTFPPLPQPVKAGTQFSYSRGMQGWVDLVGLVTYWVHKLSNLYNPVCFVSILMFSQLSRVSVTSTTNVLCCVFREARMSQRYLCVPADHSCLTNVMCVQHWKSLMPK